MLIKFFKKWRAKFFFAYSLTLAGHEKYFEALEKINKIDEKIVTDEPTFFSFKALLYALLNQFEMSIIYSKKGLYQIEDTKKYNLDEKKYLKIYAYNIYIYSLEAIGKNSEANKIKSLKSSIQYNKNNVRKYLLRDFRLM